MKKKFSKTVRWILGLDRLRLDEAVDEILCRNREALYGKRKEWSRLHSS